MEPVYHPRVAQSNVEWQRGSGWHMGKDDFAEFKAPEGKSVKLAKWATRVKPLYKSKADYERMLREDVERMAKAQARLYANGRKALLVVLQGMDAGGKDGLIRHVFSGINPQGCRVTSFKQPSSTELKHDFLWRCVRELPEHGQIGVFNRSYYEEVLVTRVHPEFLKMQNLPDLSDMKKFWKSRYEAIVNFERHLTHSGTQVVKFYLHMSKEEQRQRFIARIDDPEKNWKFNAQDVKERELWDKYQDAYERCIEATSTDEAPWYILPADDKENARLIVSEVLADRLTALEKDFPQVPAAQKKQLDDLRKLLMAESK
jgi:PPK2 family polyphosphate:nucleotide phosphotransferase